MKQKKPFSTFSKLNLCIYSSRKFSSLNLRRIICWKMDPLAAQQYCLKWNTHHNNLLAVFEDLLNNEAFVDVTLACDGLHLKAHKVVLSACSPYFQSLLFSTPDTHPIIFLKDVRFNEMKALLEFMYRGEVYIDRDSLSSLLKVAESLRIKGLAEVNCETRGQHYSEDFKPSSFQNLLPNTLLAAAAGSSHLYGLHPLANVENCDPVNKQFAQSSNSHLPGGQLFLGPKRKRGRPRRLSGSEAVPMASSLPESGPLLIDLHPEDMTINVEPVRILQKES
jgi:Cys2His2 zinc finger developmental/cell cycle regulator